MGGKSTKQDTPTHQHGTFRNVINRYSKKCGWLINDNFLRDLEDDSLDAELLDEELRILHEQQPKTLRGKIIKTMDSSPLQTALCVLVMIDAAVVVAEILLDIHAIRSRQNAATGSLHHAMDFIWNQYPTDLNGFEDDTVQAALSHLTHKYETYYNYVNGTSNDIYKFSDNNNKTFNIENQPTDELLQKHSKAIKTDESDEHSFSGEVTVSTQESNLHNQFKEHSLRISRIKDHRIIRLTDAGTPIGGHPDHAIRISKRELIIRNETETTNDRGNSKIIVGGIVKMEKPRVYRVHDAWSDKLIKISHLLHYASIIILAIFVVQVLLRVIGFGSEFFRHKFEVFDAIIIIASFALDLVFLDGIASTEGEGAIAIIFTFLLWRILRVINGLMVTAKKRHEFRLKLQKKARRRLEKKLEVMESDISAKKKELQNLKDLCVIKGATDRELFQCKPSRCAFQSSQMNTSMGLSSIASLSMGFTMSMKGRFNNVPVTPLLFPSSQSGSPHHQKTPSHTPTLKLREAGGLSRLSESPGRSTPNFAAEGSNTAGPLAHCSSNPCESTKLLSAPGSSRLLRPPSANPLLQKTSSVSERNLTDEAKVSQLGINLKKNKSNLNGAFTRASNDTDTPPLATTPTTATLSENSVTEITAHKQGPSKKCLPNSSAATRETSPTKNGCFPFSKHVRKKSSKESERGIFQNVSSGKKVMLKCSGNSKFSVQQVQQQSTQLPPQKQLLQQQNQQQLPQQKQLLQQLDQQPANDIGFMPAFNKNPATCQQHLQPDQTRSCDVHRQQVQTEDEDHRMFNTDQPQQDVELLKQEQQPSHHQDYPASRHNSSHKRKLFLSSHLLHKTQESEKVGSTFESDGIISTEDEGKRKSCEDGQGSPMRSSISVPFLRHQKRFQLDEKMKLLIAASHQQEVDERKRKDRLVVHKVDKLMKVEFRIGSSDSLYRVHNSSEKLCARDGFKVSEDDNKVDATAATTAAATTASSSSRPNDSEATERRRKSMGNFSDNRKQQQHIINKKNSASNHKRLFSKKIPEEIKRKKEGSGGDDDCRRGDGGDDDDDKEKDDNGDGDDDDYGVDKGEGQSNSMLRSFSL